jgi:hypothetical protein
MTAADSRWLDDALRPLVVAAMIACVAASWVGLISLMSPGWRGTYLIVFCFLVALEAFATRKLMNTRLHRLDARWRYRLAEIFMLYLLLQIVANINAGRANVLAGIPNLEASTIFSFILVMFCWGAATSTASELEDLTRPPEDYRGWVPPSESLYKRFLAGGALLLVGAGLSRIEIANLLNLSRPGTPGLVLNVAVYFLLGVMMLGQMQYTTLNQRWRTQGARVSSGLAGRWVRYSAVFLVLVALLAFVLPTGYTVGLLDLARYVLSLIFALMLLAISLIALPLLWLLKLLGFGPGAAGMPRMKPPTPPMPPAETASGGGDFLELLRNVLFWVIALGIVAYFARSYVRQGGRGAGLVRMLARLGPVRLLLRLRAALWRRLRGYARAVGERLPRRGAPPATPEQAATRRPSLFRRPGSLPPREQVLYYYLDTVRRAAERGYPRRRSQTPQEYSSTLAPNLPEKGQAEISGLTDAFIVARYSPHEVEPEEAGDARSRWQRLQDALGALGRTDRDAAKKPPPPARQ